MEPAIWREDNPANRIGMVSKRLPPPLRLDPDPPSIGLRVPKRLTGRFATTTAPFQPRYVTLVLRRSTGFARSLPLSAFQFLILPMPGGSSFNVSALLAFSYHVQSSTTLPSRRV